MVLAFLFGQGGPSRVVTENDRCLGACRPCIFIVATEDIKKGTELLLNYGDYWKNFRAILQDQMIVEKTISDIVEPVRDNLQAIDTHLQRIAAKQSELEATMLGLQKMLQKTENSKLRGPPPASEPLAGSDITQEFAEVALGLQGLRNRTKSVGQVIAPFTKPRTDTGSGGQVYKEVSAIALDEKRKAAWLSNMRAAVLGANDPTLGAADLNKAQKPLDSNSSVAMSEQRQEDERMAIENNTSRDSLQVEFNDQTRRLQSEEIHVQEAQAKGVQPQEVQDPDNRDVRDQVQELELREVEALIMQPEEVQGPEEDSSPAAMPLDDPLSTPAPETTTPLATIVWDPPKLISRASPIQRPAKRSSAVFDDTSATPSKRMKKELADQLEISVSAETVAGGSILKRLCQKLLLHLVNLPSAGIFSEEIDLEEYPDYLHFVKTPMDFVKIHDNIRQGRYSTLEAFVSDVSLVFSNCRAYNREPHEYFKIAEDFDWFFKKHLSEDVVFCRKCSGIAVDNVCSQCHSHLRRSQQSSPEMAYHNVIKRFYPADEGTGVIAPWPENAVYYRATIVHQGSKSEDYGVKFLDGGDTVVRMSIDRILLYPEPVKDKNSRLAKHNKVLALMPAKYAQDAESGRFMLGIVESVTVQDVDVKFEIGLESGTEAIVSVKRENVISIDDDFYGKVLQEQNAKFEVQVEQEKACLKTVAISPAVIPVSSPLRADARKSRRLEASGGRESPGSVSSPHNTKKQRHAEANNGNAERNGELLSKTGSRIYSAKGIAVAMRRAGQSRQTVNVTRICACDISIYSGTTWGVLICCRNAHGCLGTGWYHPECVPPTQSQDPTNYDESQRRRYLKKLDFFCPKCSDHPEDVPPDTKPLSYTPTARANISKDVAPAATAVSIQKMPMTLTAGEPSDRTDADSHDEFDENEYEILPPGGAVWDAEGPVMFPDSDDDANANSDGEQGLNGKLDGAREPKVTLDGPCLPPADFCSESHIVGSPSTQKDVKHPPRKVHATDLFAFRSKEGILSPTSRSDPAVESKDFPPMTFSHPAMRAV
ncbi:hypothetical protein DFJ77DRAFT_29219 [Powellomyces hirtus]|nr:hypothetical protein DFJ77DRAFT_29219 [Powellomyces hirtus]